MNKTDNEIIKALECCIQEKEDDCLLCPLCNEWNCTHIRDCATLDLINRQRAEIEKLKAELREVDLAQEEEQREHEKWLENQNKLFVEAVAFIRAEAIKEFLESAKSKAHFSEDFGEACVSCNDLDRVAEELNAQKQNEGKWIEHYSFDVWHYDCPFCDDGYATRGRDTTHLISVVTVVQG